VLLAAQHHSKDPTGRLRHEWESVGYYLCSGSNGWSYRCKNGLLRLLGVKQLDGAARWKDRSVSEIFEVCQEAIPAQASNEPSSRDWTQMFVYSTIAMLERVNGSGTQGVDTGGVLSMLGLCQPDDTGSATPKYTICPCLQRVTHAEEKCSYCGVMTPLSVPATSPSGSKEWKDLKPGDSNFQATRRSALEVVQIIHEAEAYVSRHGHRAVPDSMTPDRCNHLVNDLILVVHMVSFNEAISLGNALLTLGMSDVYQSRIIQSILCTRTSINPDVPGDEVALWEL